MHDLVKGGRGHSLRLIEERPYGPQLNRFHISRGMLEERFT
jgi:hypothetical protein